MFKNATLVKKTFEYGTCLVNDELHGLFLTNGKYAFHFKSIDEKDIKIILQALKMATLPEKGTAYRWNRNGITVEKNYPQVWRIMDQGQETEANLSNFLYQLTDNVQLRYFRDVENPNLYVLIDNDFIKMFDKDFLKDIKWYRCSDRFISFEKDNVNFVVIGQNQEKECFKF